MRQKPKSKKRFFAAALAIVIVLAGGAYVLVGAFVLKRVPKEQTVASASSSTAQPENELVSSSGYLSTAEPVSGESGSSDKKAVQGAATGASQAVSGEEYQPLTGAPALHKVSQDTPQTDADAHKEAPKGITQKVQSLVGNLF